MRRNTPPKLPTKAGEESRVAAASGGLAVVPPILLARPSAIAGYRYRRQAARAVAIVAVWERSGFEIPGSISWVGG